MERLWEGNGCNLPPRSTVQRVFHLPRALRSSASTSNTATFVGHALSPPASHALQLNVKYSRANLQSKQGPLRFPALPENISVQWRESIQKLFLLLYLLPFLLLGFGWVSVKFLCHSSLPSLVYIENKGPAAAPPVHPIMHL